MNKRGDKMVEEHDWSNVWVFKNDKGEMIDFIRCLKCNKAMPLFYKKTHKCVTEEVNKSEQRVNEEVNKAVDFVQKIDNIIHKKAMIMSRCRDAAEKIYGKSLNPEHIASVNSLFIASEREAR